MTLSPSSPANGNGHRIRRPKAVLRPALYFLVAAAPLAAGEQKGTDSRTGRLGFHFDAQAHAAAVAAADSGPLQLEPPPPGVIRLPRQVVRENRLPMEGDDLLTPEGRIEVAKQRHLSPLYRATLGPLSAVLSLINNPLGGWNPNGPEAMALYDQAQQQRRSQREADLSEIAELADQAKKIEAAAKPPARAGR